jgi:hypothetical protein
MRPVGPIRKLMEKKSLLKPGTSLIWPVGTYGTYRLYKEIILFSSLEQA